MLILASTLLSGIAAHAVPVHSNYNYFLRTHYADDALYDDNSAPGGAQQQYDDRAYPNKYVTYDQVIGANNAFQTVAKHPFALRQSGQAWQSIGPDTTNVPGVVTYTGHATTISGRITALAVADSCTPKSCHIWLGAAGGGIWQADNGISQNPNWHSTNNGIASQAIGSITIDPNDKSGKTLYVGTGEPNGSSDSEAGVGLYKSTDGGKSWHLVVGSVAAAKDRSIGAVAIDPKDAKHIYIGTDVARHGSSSVNGGRFTPPHAPVIGLYESRDGGKTFSLVFSQGSDVVNPGSPNGSDFFRGGVTKILFNRVGIPAGQPSQIYFSMFDYGLFRSANGSFEQVFASAGGGSVANSAGSRTEFALAPNHGTLRIYVGDTDGVTANLYRVDNANVPATTLTDGTNNPGWTLLSNPNPGTPGFASYNFCNAQCSYDMWVASPPGRPDTVWLGGSMQYAEIFTANPPSNGRAVQRSTDAGVSFTDMTDDAQTPPVGLHPDQHAVAFASSNPDIAFMGSDGGIVRTGGNFTDTSAQCATRGLSGADLADCQMWLKAIPTRLYSLNAGLQTLQFQSLTVNPKDPKHDVIGGTQDNGTLAYSGDPNNWLESVGGDGGQSVIDVGNPKVRMHTYFGPNGDVNFHGNSPTGWDFMAAPLLASGEAASFYVPLIGDPQVSGTMFVGLEHVWRTQDNGGSQAFLDANCSEFLPTVPTTCGDWVPLGPNLVDTTFGTDKSGSYVVATSRAPSDHSTLWTATRRGRLFVSSNADAPAGSVTFTRIDTAAQPNRFISGIAVDPHDTNHAFVSFSGYNAYTPATPGHVFDVKYNPTTGKATWKDISFDLGDMPITSIAYDGQDGSLYASTDFGVMKLMHGNEWDPAASGLPPVAVYGLTISESGHLLYAATHGRGAWRLKL
ncbi:MAG: hypothetical protein M3Y81_22855 [Chloroflexota bacterium]|nr:hypothetical protein [Chloroflexota bacterium]